MSAPDPEGMTLLAKVLGAGAAVAVPIWGFLKLWDKKADKHAVANQLQEVKGELAVQRSSIGKLFDVIRENDQRAQDRHERLLERITAEGD